MLSRIRIVGGLTLKMGQCKKEVVKFLGKERMVYVAQ